MADDSDEPRDVGSDAAPGGRPVDGVARRQIFRSERDIPVPLAPAAQEPVGTQASSGSLYGRQGTVGEGYYDEDNLFHPGKGSEQAETSVDGQGGSGEGEDQGEAGGEQSGGRAEQGRRTFHQRVLEAEDLETAGGAGGGATGAAEAALEDEALEAAAVETAGLALLVLWAKEHPEATAAIVFFSFVALIFVLVMLAVFIGEFACNGTFAGVASWINGKTGGTDFCGMLPKF